MLAKPKKKKTESVSRLRKRADTAFSRYIRLKYADPHTGIVACVTCGMMKHWKEMQNGHYISRGCSTLRYSEKNCHVQCPSCNVFKNGNYPRYALFMLKTYGPEVLSELDKESKKAKSWTAAELRELIDFWQNAINSMVE